MGLSAPPISLTWAYQHRLSAEQWAYQQRYSADKGLSPALLSQHGLISTAYPPNMGFSATPVSLTWAYQHRLSA